MLDMLILSYGNIFCLWKLEFALGITARLDLQFSRIRIETLTLYKWNYRRRIEVNGGYLFWQVNMGAAVR